MIQKILTITLFATTLIFSVQAQSTWSLQKCIEYARQNSLSVKQAQYNIRNAELGKKQADYNRLPTINGSASLGYQFGRTIDPTTNAFESQGIGFNSFSLDASVVLFNGNRINNAVKQGKLDLEIAKLDGETTANDIGLSVANAYLNILLANEQLANAQKRIELSRTQLEQTDRLINAGTRPSNERLDFLAQIARDEQTIIDAENLVNNGYLNLKQLLELPPNENIQVEQPIVTVPVANPDQFTLSELYAAALQTQPQIESGEKQIQSAQLSETLARSSLLPRLVLFGSLNANYSSVAKDLTNPNLDNRVIVPNPPETVLIDGQEAMITTFDVEGITFPNKPYFDQVNENFGQTVGLSLSVPIYNNSSNRLALERARITTLNAEVNNRQINNFLKTDIQSSISNARAGKRSYEAAQRTVEAAQAAFDSAQKRFDLGAINSLEYTTARNNLDQAETDLIRAKYQYVFYLKIIDFYQGKPILLN
ncbi:MAG: transporter [Saprospiraceae bacterium]|nr:MAG: transporter [Saprospiraceae bacterium]